MLAPRQYAALVRSVTAPRLPGGRGAAVSWHYAVGPTVALAGDRIHAGICPSREQAWACALAALKGMLHVERAVRRH